MNTVVITNETPEVEVDNLKEWIDATIKNLDGKYKLVITLDIKEI